MDSRVTAALVAILLVGCGAKSASPIQVDLGPGSVQRSFVPHTALAEALVLRGRPTELRLLLAEGDASCDRHVAPEANHLLATVTVFIPEGQALGPGPVPWLPPQPARDGKEPPPKPYAVPRVHVGEASHSLAPGGGIQLSTVDLAPNGVVAGTLGFEAPATAKAPATQLTGQFSARICHAEGLSPP